MFIQGTHDKHRVSLVILARFKPSINCAIFAPPAIARIITPNPIVCIVLNNMHSHDLSQSKQVDSLDTAFFQALIKIYTRKVVTVVPLLKVILPSYLQRDNGCFRIIDWPCKSCTNAGKETIITAGRAIFHVDQFLRQIYWRSISDIKRKLLLRLKPNARQTVIRFFSLICTIRLPLIVTRRR